jgi:polyisoprenyl-phosphate glycosyltransferase
VTKVLSVVVPVYFNAESLPALFAELQAIEEQLLSRGVELELVFVDDGSGDESFAELVKIKEQRRPTKVVRLTRNFGAVHASKCGLSFVTGDCFMVLAADLQDPPELISKLVDKWLAGSRFTICERIAREDPLVSRAFSAVFYWLVHRLVISDYPSGGYDMALMDAALLPHLRDSSKNLYTPLLAYWLGYRPEVITYHRPKRRYGKSRWSFRKKFIAFLDVVLGFSVRPIRLISGLGAVVAATSFCYGLSVIVHALLGQVPVPGFASLAALLAFLVGLVIVMLGVIGEYLWRVFDEVNRRAEVVIDEIL